MKLLGKIIQRLFGSEAPEKREQTPIQTFEAIVPIPMTQEPREEKPAKKAHQQQDEPTDGFVPHVIVSDLRKLESFTSEFKQARKQLVEELKKLAPQSGSKT